METAAGLPFNLKWFVAFKALDAVVETCFGNKYDPAYKEKIQQFRTAYLELNISVTPKIHMILEHIVQFIEIPYQLGNSFHSLGIYSEQAFESVHRDFVKVLSNYSSSNKNEQNHSDRLLRAVCKYNSLNV